MKIASFLDMAKTSRNRWFWLSKIRGTLIGEFTKGKTVVLTLQLSSTRFVLLRSSLLRDLLNFTASERCTKLGGSIPKKYIETGTENLLAQRMVDWPDSHQKWKQHVCFCLYMCKCLHDVTSHVSLDTWPTWHRQLMADFACWVQVRDANVKSICWKSFSV